MKAVRSSSQVLIVPLLSSSSHAFASPVSDRGNIIRRTTSFSGDVLLCSWLFDLESSEGVVFMLGRKVGKGLGYHKGERECRKAHFLEDKQIPSVAIYDEVSFAQFGKK
ncbi:hypothetical protein Tco_0721597 [Tanacetum coccineum]